MYEENNKLNQTQTQNNENKNTITYDEGWQTVSEIEYKNYSPKENNSVSATEDSAPSASKQKRPKQLLITIQLIICLIIALAAFIIKGIGGDFYNQIRSFYYSNLNSSAVFDGDKTFDFNSVFGTASDDEAKTARD